ncbi:pectinesterase family protein, partial [Kineococcus indalonis]|uniref:pectinesterase family protein n=1 Tax=Kineococcus indalonis TaxID=2696566 RepID=UPI00196B436A
VQPGTYTGTVSSARRNVTLLGAGTGPEDTVITSSGTVATVQISGQGWTVRNLTVSNTGASTALQTQGDKSVFEDVRILGDKQALKIGSPNPTTAARAYFHRVFVEGGADALIGRGTAVFADSTFHLLNRPGNAMTDSSVDASFEHGFLITGSRILTDGAAGTAYLGRPYPETPTAVAQVVVRDSEIGAAIGASPWRGYKDATRDVPWTAGRFAEHRNTGAGAAVVDPAARPQLSDADAERYTAAAYLAGTDGWNPTAG